MRTDRHAWTAVIVAGLLTSACSSSNNSLTSPSSAAPSDAIGSVVPPPVNRGPVPPASPSPPASASCDAAKAQWAKGQRASSDLLERARNAAEARVARFIRPNEPITMEFLPGRLNLGLDKQDVVNSVSCG
jgi:Peptidase inhibitor I78 family